MPFRKENALATDIQNAVIENVLSRFSVQNAKINPHGTGLINHTWKIEANGGNFILQRLNENVFGRPQDIDENITLISNYLAEHHPDYFFVRPVKTESGETLVQDSGGGWFRLFPFVDSVTHDVASLPDIAFEAAFQFGRFTEVLSDFDAGRLHVTIPDFHNLSYRYKQFLDALKSGNEERIKQSEPLIEKVRSRASLVDEFEEKIAHPAFHLRTTHHDTKISNVLFNRHGKGICVIDLDTVMPGYFFSDVGDMMRTYLSPVSEEEKDFSKIEVRRVVYDAIVEGYRAGMNGRLSPEEVASFHFAGRFMVFMQAMRFLTDYLNGDRYYGSKYEGHNFVRAGNQITLLEKLEELKL